MPTDSGVIIGLGEVLWDLLPGGRQLGGAPFNFTFHCHQLGHAALMVSRVGRDEPGQAIRAAVRNKGLSDAWIQTDDRHPTGTVQVALNEHGHPTYTITPEVAYDYLLGSPDLEKLLAGPRAVCFGTLVQRHPVSRETIQRLVRIAARAIVIFDINLRQSFYSRELIEESLRISSWLKLNDEELVVLRDLLDLAGTTEAETTADLRQRYGLQLIALTRGEHGCLVQTNAELIEVPGVRVQVADTIGAGDAFTAGLLASVLEGRSVGEAAHFANRLAACVAGKQGGTPAVARAEIDGLLVSGVSGSSAEPGAG
jgi:fructokinase